MGKIYSDCCYVRWSVSNWLFKGFLREVFYLRGIHEGCNIREDKDTVFSTTEFIESGSLSTNT